MWEKSTERYRLAMRTAAVGVAGIIAVAGVAKLNEKELEIVNVDGCEGTVTVFNPGIKNTERIVAADAPKEFKAEKDGYTVAFNPHVRYESEEDYRYGYATREATIPVGEEVQLRGHHDDREYYLYEGMGEREWQIRDGGHYWEKITEGTFTCDTPAPECERHPNTPLLPDEEDPNAPGCFWPEE